MVFGGDVEKQKLIQETAWGMTQIKSSSLNYSLLKVISYNTTLIFTLLLDTA